MTDLRLLSWDLDRVIEGLNDLDPESPPAQHIMEDRERLIQTCIQAKRALMEMRA